MALWQKIKQTLALAGQKALNLETLENGSVWDSYFFNYSRRSNLRISAANPAESYRKHELVFACINKIADVMNDAEIMVEKRNKDGEYEEVPGHPLVSLFNKPNASDIGEDFRRKMVISEQTAGITYIAINRSRAGIPAELLVLNPFRVTPRPNAARTKIEFYEYAKTNGKPERIEPEDMFIRRRPDVFNQFGGLAPVAVALGSINSDLGLTTYIDAFFESDGTPSGILKILNRTISQTAKEKLQADWKLTYGKGGTNQRGLAVLDDNAEFQKIGSNLNELDSEAVSSRFESKICGVFGVPPILVSAYVGLRWVNQRASAKEALRDFWANKISPELKPLRKWLTWYVLAEFEDIEKIKSGEIRVGWDITQAAFLQEELDRVHERAQKNFTADVVTRNESREMLGMKPVDGGDLFRSEIINAQVKERLASRPAPVALPEPAEDDDEDEKTKALKKKSQLKGYEWEGLTLSREPTDLEQSINLKGKVEDLESHSAKISKLILAIRKDLITQAADQAETLGADGIPGISLTIPGKYEKQLKKLLKDAFKAGQTQVIEELNAQLKAGNPLELKIRIFSIGSLVKLILGKIVADIINRAINLSILLYALNIFAKDEFESRLRDESQKSFEQLARNAANLGIQAGRDDELDNNEIDLYEYSAILDINTCPPCRKWDGEQSSNIEDLPQAPNKDCEGGWNCRCFVIGIIV